MIIATPIGCTRVIGKQQRYKGLPLRNSIDFRLYCYLGDKADGNSVSVPD